MPTNNNVKRKSGRGGFEIYVSIKGDADTFEALERLGATVVYGRPSWRRWESWRNPWKLWCAVLLTAFAFELPILVARALS